MITIRNILWINGKPVCCRKLWICNINWTNWEEEQFLFWSKSQKFLYHFSDLQLQWKQAFLELLCVEDNSNMGRCITLFKWLLDLVIKMSIIPYFMHTHTHTHIHKQNNITKISSKPTFKKGRTRSTSREKISANLANTTWWRSLAQGMGEGHYRRQ